MSLLRYGEGGFLLEKRCFIRFYLLSIDLFWYNKIMRFLYEVKSWLDLIYWVYRKRYAKH